MFFVFFVFFRVFCYVLNRPNSVKSLFAKVMQPKSCPHKWTINPKYCGYFRVERPFMRSGLGLRYFCKKWFYTVGTVQNVAKNTKKHKKYKNILFCYFFEKLNKDKEFTFVKNSIFIGFKSVQQCRFTLLTISYYHSCLYGARLEPQKRIPEIT